MLEASLVVVVSYAMDTLVTVGLILEQIVTREPIAQLVGVGALIKDHLQDRPHQQSIVPASSNHVGPLGELVEFLLGQLLQLFSFVFGEFWCLGTAIVT